MKLQTKTLTEEQVAEAKARRLTAAHLQAIESNPLDAEDVAMFEMFEREGWPHDRRRAYIIERARTAAMIPFAPLAEGLISGDEQGAPLVRPPPVFAITWNTPPGT